MESRDNAGDGLVYYVSDRPEAYELWGEISHEDAARIGRLVAERAGARFPAVKFQVDSEWHVHQRGADGVSAFIDENLAAWVNEVTSNVTP